MTRQRSTAGERREDLLRAAITEFAVTGYHGTPTEAIAKRAGISQPYLFRLFGTKRELFVACVERCFDRIHDAFRAAAEDPPPDCESALEAMGNAYVEMLADRELLLFQLQTYAASADDAIRTAARRRYHGLVEEVLDLSGAPPEDVRTFLGSGMLLNVAAALELSAEAVGFEP